MVTQEATITMVAMETAMETAMAAKGVMETVETAQAQAMSKIIVVVQEQEMRDK